MEKRIKKTYICADVTHFQLDTELITYYIPKVGDVAVFEIVSIGKHSTVQSETKLHTLILPGDLIMAAFGTRYATEQFEGYVPTTCQQEFHILGAGGTVGRLESMHAKFQKVGPTVLKIVGYATSNTGEVLNTKTRKAAAMYSFSSRSSALTNIILSVGSAMDSGKTTTAGYLVRGLKGQGYKTAFIKLTGTVYTKDTDLVYDLGADIVSNFGDMGFPSTYMCEEPELLDLYETLLRKVLSKNPTYVVIEIADGIFQRETKMLLTNKNFMALVDGVIFSAGDSLAALQGVQMLKSWNIVPFALSGLLTASPLLVREVQENCNIPVFNIGQLAAAEFLHLLERPFAHRAMVVNA